MNKKVSQRTKDVKKLSKIFGFLSFLCFVGVAIFTIIACFTRLGGSEEQGMEIISEQLKNTLVSFSITLAIVVVCAFLIKEKVRTTIYMFALVVNGILFKEIGMYSILAVWALDEFIFSMLYKKYKRLTEINKEIDKRA